MSMSVRCAGCGLRVRGRTAASAACSPACAAAASRATCGMLDRGAALPPARAARQLAGRATGRPGPPDASASSCRAAASARTSPRTSSLPLVAAVWSCPPGTACDYPARYLFAFLANHGMLSVTGLAALAHRGRRLAPATSSGSPSGCHGVRPSTPVRAVRRHRGRRRASRRRPARPADVRRRGHRHPPGPGAAPARPTPTAAEREVLGAIGYTPQPDRCCTPTPRCCRAARAPRRRGTTCWPAARAGRRPRPGQLRHEPAAAPATRPSDYVVTLNGAGRRSTRTGDRPDGLRAPGLHPGLGRRPAPAARAERRRSPPSPAPTTAGASTRTAAGPASQAAARPGGDAGDRGGHAARLYECRITPRPARTRCATRSRYRSYLWLVDLDQLPRLPRGLRLLARFSARDHLGDPRRSHPGEPRPLPGRARHRPRRRPGLMLAHARVLGYVFNPLTVYWCHRADGTLACVVAEVHNTYGERHGYLLRTDERGRAEAPQGVLRLAVLPGRRPLPDEPARARRPPRAEHDARHRPDGRAVRGQRARPGRPGHRGGRWPPPRSGTRGPPPSSPPGSAGRASSSTCAGCRPAPRPAHRPQEGVQ